MAWPEATDYNEAIQNPTLCFADADLRAGRTEVNALGWPLPCSGNFAAVYKVFGPDGTPWAVKCFTRETPHLRERYQAVSAYLQQAGLPFTIDFQYLEQGIRIRGIWYAVVKMRWIEGLTLNEFLKQHLDRPTVLDRLAQLWLKLARELRRAKIAHADLQHGNVILVLGAKTGTLSVRLIDYDGMFVPALANARSGELGHANYQHPERARQGAYDMELDRFPHLVIYTALRALAVDGRRLWAKYDNGENLLFREQDFLDPSKSSLLLDLWQLGDPTVQALARQLALACRSPINSVSLLSELPNLVEGTAPVLNTNPEEEPRALLGEGAGSIRQPRAGILVSKARGARFPEKQAIPTPRPWYQQPSVFVGAAASLLLLLVVIVWRLVGDDSSTDIADAYEAEIVGAEPKRTQANKGSVKPKDQQPKKAPDKGNGQSKAKVGDKAIRADKGAADKGTASQDKGKKDAGKSDAAVKYGTPPEAPKSSEVPNEPPSPRVVEIGRFEPPILPASTVLLQLDPDKGSWMRLERQIKPTRVLTARPLVSLPGFRSVIHTDKGVKLTLAGTMPEFFPGTPMLFESLVTLHAHDVLDLDLTLHRGRIFLTNTQERPLRVRLRFENSTDPALPQLWDITLEETDTEVMIDCFGFFKPGQPFAVGPMDAKREGPMTQVGLTVSSGSVQLRADNVAYGMQAPPGPARMAWNSAKGGLSGPHKFAKLEEWARVNPAIPKGVPKELQGQRKDMERACNELSKILAGRPAELGLNKSLTALEAVQRRLTVRCFGAVDMPSQLVDALGDMKHPDVRRAAIETLMHWIAASRDNEYKLYADLKERFAPVESEKMIWMLHGPLLGASPQTYESLIDLLLSPRLPIRELAAWQLYAAFPRAHEEIRFDANQPPEILQRVQAHWRKYLKTQGAKAPG